LIYKQFESSKQTEETSFPKKMDTIQQYTMLLTPIFKKTGVIKAILFGSLSRDTGTRRSDLDLIIVKNSTRRFFDRFEQFDIIHDIIKDRAIDLLIYTPGELAKITHRPFIRKIMSEGQCIYEC